MRQGPPRSAGASRYPYRTRPSRRTTATSPRARKAQCMAEGCTPSTPSASCRGSCHHGWEVTASRGSGMPGRLRTPCCTWAGSARASRGQTTRSTLKACKAPEPLQGSPESPSESGCSACQCRWLPARPRAGGSAAGGALGRTWTTRPNRPWRSRCHRTPGPRKAQSPACRPCRWPRCAWPCSGCGACECAGRCRRLPCRQSTPATL
mmetsp:Transcript_98476/g.287169  ORF Transcript_98476/g.287169 Transcript_98476/m.287169 type:complete len:207 (-) Transcript_98476:126-746(-)